MAKHENKVSDDQVPASEPEDTGTSDKLTGIRTRKAIMLREFLPSQEWVAGNVVAKGKGTKVMLGAIHGIVTDTETREAKLPDGTTKPSIVCKGMFESTNFVTGEISRASSVYFPAAFAEEIAAMFKADSSVQIVKVDTDIGIEATGKPIPYTWVVVQYVEEGKKDILTDLRNARIRHQPNPLQLTHSK